MRAGSWVLAGHGANQLIRLASNLVMTRLLVPEMFGLMAVAWLFMTGLQLISDMGLRQSIVRSQRADDPLFRGTAWFLQIIRGTVLWLCGLMIAGLIYFLQFFGLVPAETVYAEPALCFVVAILSFTALIAGFESTRVAMAERNMAQEYVVRMELLSLLCGTGSMIAWALLDRTIWALVAGGLVAAMTRMLLSHMWLPGNKDALCWDKEIAGDLFGFGKWIFLSSSLTFAVNSGDRLLLGGLVSAQLLGLYAIAFLVVDAASQVISKLLGAVSYPALCEVARERPKELKVAYYRTRLPIDALALSACGLLYVSGDAIIPLMFDARYREAGNIVEVLALTLFFLRYGAAEMCCLVLNKPQILSIQVAIRGVALYIIVPVTFHYFGFSAALWAIAMHRVFSLLPIFLFKAKYGLFDAKRELLAFSWLVAGLIVGWGIRVCILSF